MCEQVNEDDTHNHIEHMPDHKDNKHVILIGSVIFKWQLAGGETWSVKKIWIFRFGFHPLAIKGQKLSLPYHFHHSMSGKPTVSIYAANGASRSFTVNGNGSVNAAAGTLHVSESMTLTHQ